MQEDLRAKSISAIIGELKRRSEASSNPESTNLVILLTLLPNLVFELEGELSDADKRAVLPLVEEGLRHQVELRRNGQDTVVAVRNYAAAVSWLAEA